LAMRDALRALSKRYEWRGQNELNGDLPPFPEESDPSLRESGWLKAVIDSGRTGRLRA